MGLTEEAHTQDSQNARTLDQTNKNFEISFFPSFLNSGRIAVIVQWLVLFVVAEATQVRILVTADSLTNSEVHIYAL